MVNFQKLCGILPASNTKGRYTGILFRNFFACLVSGTDAIAEEDNAGHKKQASDSDKGNESDDDKNNNTATNETNSYDGVKPPKKFGVPTNFFLHWLFTLGTAAGHEMFYIIVLPLIYWNANHIVSRRYFIFAYAHILQHLIEIP